MDDDGDDGGGDERKQLCNSWRMEFEKTYY
jgi:hypothetical protein